MRKLANMSGEIRDRAEFTFQAGREIKGGGLGSCLPWFDTVQKQSIHPSLAVKQPLWRNNSVSEHKIRNTSVDYLVYVKYHYSVIFPIEE